MFSCPQPYRYGSKRMAKTPALVLVMKGPTASDPTRHRVHFACFGNKGHYRRADGVCCHLEGVIARMRPWYRERTWYLPFGDNKRKARRALEEINS